MSEKLRKPYVILPIVACLTLLIFVCTDLYRHFFALSVYSNVGSHFIDIVMVICIAIFFDALFVIANLARKKYSKWAMRLTTIIFPIVLIVILVLIPLTTREIGRAAIQWSGTLTYVAFGLEAVGFIIFFLLLAPSLRLKTTIIACSVVLAVSVTAISCWGSLGSSIVDAATTHEWELDAPEYASKHLSRKYNCGVMKADEYHDGKNGGPSKESSFMQVASRTDKKSFDAYCEKVAASGYVLTGSSDIETISSRTFIKDGKMLHVYYNSREKVTRIITDPVSASPAAASYSYTVQPGDTTAIYQYALMYDDDCDDNYEYGGGIERCGMDYIIKLADNKLIIIDGGDICQASDSAIDGFYDLCKEITGNEDLTIACWIGTHAHGDHVSFFSKFLYRYNEHIALERFMYNYPNWKEVDNGNEDATYLLFRRFEKYAPDALQIKPHTGETFTFGNAKLEILYTHEDAFDYKVNKTKVYDFNDTSTTYRFTFNDNTTFMVVGDMSAVAQQTVANNYTAKTLKSDIAQAAHHGFNELDVLYPIFDAEYLFFPQGYDNAVLGENKGAGRNYKVAKKYTAEENIFLINRETYGLIIAADGTITKDPTIRPYIGPDFTNGQYFDGSGY